MPKQSSRKVKYDGYTFDSTTECSRYKHLCLLQKAGEIQGLEVHPKFTLSRRITLKANQVLSVKKTNTAITYEADFAYYQDDIYVVEDVKGYIAKRHEPYITETAKKSHRLLWRLLQDVFKDAWQFRILCEDRYGTWHEF